MPRVNKKILVATKIIVSVSLLAFLLSIVDIQAMLSRFRDIEFAYMVAVFFIMVCNVMLSALKWKIILASDGLDTPYFRLLQSYYIGNFLGLFLPSSFGGDVYRVYAVSATSKKLGKVTSSVLFDRLTGLAALLSLSLFGFIALADTSYDIILAGLLVLGVVTFYFMTSERVIDRIANGKHSLIRHLTTLLQSCRAYRVDSRRFWKIVAISFLFQFLIVVNNKLYTLALSIDMQFTTLLAIVPLVLLTEVLPISINGAGVRDSAYVFFFVMFGQTAEEGLAVGLLLIAMRYIGGLVGGTVLLGSFLTGTLPRRKSAE